MKTASYFLSVLLMTTALVMPVVARAASAPENQQPVLLDADHLTYDDKADTITADGHVELTQNGHTVQADRMVYNRSSGIVTAEGNVKMWEPTGDMVFATYAELSRDMRQAFVDKISLLMADNSRFIAQEGERTEGRYTRMDRTLYTACNLCADDPSAPPLWQVRAQRVIHDSEKHDVTYRNATVEMGGIPVFYTPYLSHPDPTVKRRSGFLAPIIGSRSDLGFVARTYYYLDLAPNMDATLETSYSTDRGPLLGGEWRHRGEHSNIQLNASATLDDVPTGASTENSSRMRGHFFLDASSEIAPNWRANLNIKRTTDDTYLDLWRYSPDDVMESRGEVEHFTPQSYGVARVLSYQDLRPSITSAEPAIAQALWQQQGRPRTLLGGRLGLTAETRAVLRSYGQDASRTSLATDWKRTDILPAGFIATTDLSARVDGFTAHNLNSTGEDTTTARPFAQGQMTVSWPLVNVGEHGQQFITPIAQITAAPRQRRSDSDVPNEDSLGLEFDTTNLFRANRNAGYDRVDGGQRAAYGLRTGWTGNSGSSVTAAFGQSYDFAKNPNFASGTGLEESLSDFVGAINADVPNVVNIAYSTRLDNKSLDPRVHDLRLSAGPENLQGWVSYLYINQASTDGLSLSQRQEATIGGRWKFTPYWSVSGSHQQDLERSDGAIATNLTLTYQDECMTFALTGSRDHVAKTGLTSGDSIFFRLILKNLGEFESPSFSPDLFGSSKQN